MTASRETRLPATVADFLAIAQQPARDRTARFCARLDAHLETLPDDASRAAFLAEQHAKWIGDYEGWALAVDLGAIDLKPGGATAWDYAMTIAEIGARKARYAAAVTA